MFYILEVYNLRTSPRPGPHAYNQVRNHVVSRIRVFVSVHVVVRCETGAKTPVMISVKAQGEHAKQRGKSHRLEGGI